MKSRENPGGSEGPDQQNAVSGAEVPLSWRERIESAARKREALSLERSIAPATGLDFCSNDYLGLRRDPRLAEAAAQAAKNHGAGSGAARLLRGTTPLHDALETTLANWKACEACLLFNTGFQANATLIPALTGPGDAIFSDALNHASMVDGCRMAKAGGTQVFVYRHLDLADLRMQMKAWRASSKGLALVVSDGIFSMDGDAADLPGLLELCRGFEALLMVDEAHASGLLGLRGAGLAEAQGVHGEVPLVMGTLGKALGSFGAFVAGPAFMVDHLINTARGFIFSTALPPPVVGAAIKGAELAMTERWRASKALQLAARLRESLGVPPQDSAIIPVFIGEDAKAMAIASSLQSRGFDVRAVRPPSIPKGTARLRITTGAHLEETQLESLITALKEVL